MVALQESVEFVQCEEITSKFFVTHFRGCVALFNKHTVEQNIEVKAIGTDKVECSSWAFEVVISRSRFRVTHRNGKSYFKMMS